MATFESSLPMRLEEALEPGCHWGAIPEDNHRCHRHVPLEENKWWYACRLLRMSSLKEGEMWHDSRKAGILECVDGVIAR
jgi:hypothetical protein